MQKYKIRLIHVKDWFLTLILDIPILCTPSGHFVKLFSTNINLLTTPQIPKSPSCGNLSP